MKSTLIPILAGVLALGFALYVAPILIRAAHRYGIVDRPTSALKTHKDPVPYLGGLVIFLPFLIALSFTFEFDSRVLAILLCASVVVAVGLVDDLGTLTPKDKLIGQSIAALVLVKGGVHIEIATLSSPLNEILTVFWMLTCMNAFNILDVSDGLAAMGGILASIGVIIVAFLNGEPTILTMAAALLGALLGFYYFNREPARIYLGDTGSLLLGALLGAFAMSGRYSANNEIAAYFVPLALLVMPLFDLGLVIISRLLARIPIYYGSPHHFAVRLRHHGWSARNIARIAFLLGFVFLGLGIGATRLAQTPAVAIISASIILGLLLMILLIWKFPPKSMPPEEKEP